MTQPYPSSLDEVRTEPWEFSQAIVASRKASAAQEQAEEFVKQAFKDYAETERVYREALASKILELRSEGSAATTAGDIARGDKKVAELKLRRDVAEGVKEAALHSVWRRTADRRTTEALMAWSMKRELAQGGQAPEPDLSPLGR